MGNEEPRRWHSSAIGRTDIKAILIVGQPRARPLRLAPDHRAEADEERIPDAELPAVLRTLNDGTPHGAIKLFHEPQALAELGWDAEVHSAGHRFPWGTASRR